MLVFSKLETEMKRAQRARETKRREHIRIEEWTGSSSHRSHAHTNTPYFGEWVKPKEKLLLDLLFLFLLR